MKNGNSFNRRAKNNGKEVYDCARSGKFVPPKIGTKQRAKRGTKKINGTCPASYVSKFYLLLGKAVLI